MRTLPGKQREVVSRRLDGKSVRVSIAGSVQLTEQQTHNLLAKFTFMKVLAFPLREFDRAFCKILETLIFDVIHISQPGGCLPLYRYRSGTRIPLTSKKGWRLAGRFSMTNHFYSWGRSSHSIVLKARILIPACEMAASMSKLAFPESVCFNGR